MQGAMGSPSQQARRSSGSLHAAYVGASSPMASTSSVDSRASHLDLSALSPAEFALYPRWLATIKASRSGEPEHIDEQDALRFLREECGIEVRDEIRILSLFERFPLGLLPGHFFALLRLAAWVQRGQAPSKTLLFTQTLPPTARSDVGASHSSSVAKLLTATPRTDKHGQHTSHPTSKSPGTSPRVRSTPHDTALLATPGPSTHTASAMLTPLIPIPTRQSATAADAPPPVPDDAFKPQNPFRHAAPPIPASATPHVAPQGIQGFDPAPNPFRHPAKPKIVRPTPIVANASTDVLRRPSSTFADPFKSNASASSHGGSPVSGRSLLDGAGGTELKPPPLPPRHISPLIQAGLQARNEVRRKQEMLPPKTFTVLQSTSARHGVAERPRLLTGETARMSALSNRRRADGGRVSASSGQGTKVGAEEAGPDRRSGPLPAPIAPKPSYGAKDKSGIPAWLREQEELQKTNVLESHTEPNAPPREFSSRESHPRHSRRKQRTTSEAARIQFLDNDSDSGSDEDTLSEQARSAASIDRNNPFFQHGRDFARNVDLKESLNKLAVENAVTKAERDSKLSTRATSDTSTTRGENDPRRPLGRSKTLRDAMGRSIPLSPMIGARKRTEVGPVPLHSGTYAGFGRSVRTEGPTVGGLRQTPVSRKAEVGLPAHVIAERERQQQLISTSPQENNSLRPPPPRRHASSTSQVSDSTTTGPRSPSDGVGAEDAHFGIADTSKQDFDALVDQHRWLARTSGHTKGTHLGLLPGIDDSHNEEPEVDEHYLVEKRKEAEQRLRQGMTAPHLASPWSWQQRSHPIEVIKEEDGTPRQRTASTPASAFSAMDFQQWRNSPDGLRRSASGAGGHYGHLRRSSLLSRGGLSVAEVVAEDGSNDASESERTPREKAADDDDGAGDYFVDASADDLSSPTKSGDGGLSRSNSNNIHFKSRTKSSGGSSSSASGRAGAVPGDAQQQSSAWQQLL